VAEDSFMNEEPMLIDFDTDSTTDQETGLDSDYEVNRNIINQEASSDPIDQDPDYGENNGMEDESESFNSVKDRCRFFIHMALNHGFIFSQGGGHH